MKSTKIFFYLIFMVLILSSNKVLAGRCTGSSGCNACTTCSSCRHCNGGGGSCGVCGGDSGSSSGGGLGKLALFGGGVYLLYSIFKSKSDK